MNYTDSVFLFFFLITFSSYYFVSKSKFQIIVLIGASLLFYAWESPALLSVFICTWFITSVSSYYVMVSNPRRAKLYAAIGVLSNLLFLGFFKYKLLFIGNSLSFAPNTIGEWLILAPLPIGISFYTFHGVSLVVDTFRANNKIRIESNGGFSRHLARTLLYLVFFPQLIAGPIIKAKDFFPQVTQKRFFDIDFTNCTRILILGYFLKSVIADNLSEQTFWISFPYFKFKSSIDLLLMLYGYSAQIFADFAGYSLIAIGIAKLFGYKLPDNFNFPYISSSISEFWRRWHISLSSWLRDYLYIPLGGNRYGEIRTYMNLIIVMLLGGLWHGAAWSFVFWGLWHGLGLVVERPLLGSKFLKSSNPIVVFARIFLVFNFVTIGWLFFKLQNFAQAFDYLKTMFLNDSTEIDKILVLSISVYGSFVLIYHLLSQYSSKISRGIKDSVYGLMLFFIITNSGPTKPFIYFQF